MSRQPPRPSMIALHRNALAPERFKLRLLRRRSQFEADAVLKRVGELLGEQARALVL